MRQQKACSRRRFIHIGSLGFAGLSLPALLRAESRQTAPLRKSVINIHLDGGPPQMDMIDPKPDAPMEIRGEFTPIATSLPGVELSELMPRLAAGAEALTFIRTLVGSAGRHDAFQCQSGFSQQDLQSLGGRPAMGCILSKLYGRPDDPAPTFVDLMQGRPLVRNSARPGYLGPAFGPFRPDISQMFQRELEAGMKSELARQGANHTLALTLDESLTFERMKDRRLLMARFDRIRHDVDASGMMDAMDRFQQQAVGILTSGKLAQALDLSQENPRVLSRYLAPHSGAGIQSTTSEGRNAPQKFLLARRLIEAGARMVSVSISDFDTHRNNFARLRHLVPIVDHGLATLIADLEERGMIDDVTIVAWGEFGRTPRVNGRGGRDHWPRVGPCLLAGGGLQHGQVIGTTDRVAGMVTRRPVHYKDVFATLYHALGIDPQAITLPDPQGRPQYLLDEGAPLTELL